MNSILPARPDRQSRLKALLPHFLASLILISARPALPSGQPAYAGPVSSVRTTDDKAPGSHEPRVLATRGTDAVAATQEPGHETSSALLLGVLHKGPAWTADEGSRFSRIPSFGDTHPQPLPLAADPDTVQLLGSAGVTVITALPDSVGGDAVSRYRIVTAPALSWLNEQSFFWIARPEDRGRFTVVLAADRRSGVDTLVVELNLD